MHSAHNLLLPGTISHLTRRVPEGTRQGAVLPLTILNLVVLEVLRLRFAREPDHEKVTAGRGAEQSLQPLLARRVQPLGVVDDEEKGSRRPGSHLVRQRSE